MAQQPLLGYTYFPILWPGINAGIANQTAIFVLDATGEKASTIFQIPADGNITKLGFRTATVTTGDTLKIGLYTVDASGDPTATAYKGMVAGTQVVASADDNTYFNVTLGTQATSVVKGDIVALVIEYNSYVAGNMVITGLKSTGSELLGFPYGDLYTTLWTKQNTPLFATIEYTGGVYYPTLGILPVASGGASSIVYNLDTATFDEYGIHINIPVPARVVGIWVVLAIAAGADFEAILYEGTTALKTVTYDGDMAVTTGARQFFLFFPTTQDLIANTNYYIAIRPTTANNVTFYYFTAPSVAAAAQFHGGAGAYRVKRLNQGAWTTSETTIIGQMGIILDAFSDGVGGSGGGMPILRGSVVGG